MRCSEGAMSSGSRTFEDQPRLLVRLAETVARLDNLRLAHVERGTVPVDGSDVGFEGEFDG